MIKTISIGMFLILVLGACSVKEMEDGTNGIINDISKVFEEGKDKSSQ